MRGSRCWRPQTPLCCCWSPIGWWTGPGSPRMALWCRPFRSTCSASKCPAVCCRSRHCHSHCPCRSTLGSTPPAQWTQGSLRHRRWTPGAAPEPPPAGTSRSPEPPATKMHSIAFIVSSHLCAAACGNSSHRRKKVSEALVNWRRIPPSRSAMI